MNVTTSAEGGEANAVVEERILARMKQRTDEISHRSEQRRTEQPNRNTESETADVFLASFQEMKSKLTEDLKISQDLAGDKTKMMDHFDRMVRDHGYIQQYLNESSMFLASFQLKRSQEILAELNAEIQSQMEALQPKKRFGFKNKTNKPKEKKVVPTTDDADSTEAREIKNSALDSYLQRNFFGFKDRSNETLVMKADEILNRQLNLQNLTNCTVEVLGNPGTIQAADLKYCTVLIGPTSRSAFIKRSQGCQFVLACQQVRIHDTVDSNFYLHVTGAAIIESCSNVGFAPYNLAYPQLEEHYSNSQLDRAVNYWDKVEDFKWISKNEKSPNLFHIEENDRKKNWFSNDK